MLHNGYKHCAKSQICDISKSLRRWPKIQHFTLFVTRGTLKVLADPCRIDSRRYLPEVYLGT